MFEIRLNEDLFNDAQRRATEGGFASVDEFVAEVLRDELEFGENCDHFFTPERIEEIKRADARIDQGEGITLEQFNELLARDRAEWLKQDGR